MEGVGYALAGPLLDMYSYRAEANELRGVSVALANGGSSDDVTSMLINASMLELASSANTLLESTTTLDLKVATIDADLYALALAVYAGTNAAVRSRADQVGPAHSGDLLLRSKLTVVELTKKDEINPLSLTNLNGVIYVTLAATYPFNTSHNDFKRLFACGANNDGVVIDLNCPLSDLTHTCDLTSYGGGGAYFFDFVCPYVQPVCLYWDPIELGFSSEGCFVVEGYSSDAVTCACNHLTTFVLSGNLTEPFFEAHTTPSPTSSPTHAPSPRPSRAPTPHPSNTPTHEPTAKPTRFISNPCPTFLLFGDSIHFDFFLLLFFLIHSYFKKY